MTNEIQTYLTNENELIKGLNEFKIKGAGVPLAQKIIDVYKTLTKKQKFSEEDYGACWLQMVSDASRIKNTGLDINDHDLIYPIARGKKICLQMHYSAPFRVAKRAGYMIVPDFYTIFENDEFSYQERRGDNDIIRIDVNYKSTNPFAKIDADSLISGKIKGFALRMSVKKMNEKGQLETICETITVMNNEDIISRSIRGDSAIYQNEFETNSWGNKVKIKDLSKLVKKAINTASIWFSDTKAMCYKTIVREAFRPLREIIPELHEVYKIMDSEDRQDNEFASEVAFEILQDEKVKNIDLRNLPEDIKQKANELLEMYEVNPTLADEHFEEVKKCFESCQDEDQKQQVINMKAEFIVALGDKDKGTKRPEIGALLRG